MMEHITIAHRWIFLLAPLPLLFVWLWPPLHKRRTALIAPFFERIIRLSRQKARRNAYVARRSWMAWIVLTLVWVCLLAAAASPRYEGKPTKRVKTVRSFLIVADISYSMATKDWVVDGRRLSRWEAVKSIMQDFVKNRKSDQMGLVMFGTHAYLQAPLTTDLNTINWLMDQTEVGMAGQMTSIGEAIAYGIKVFKGDTIKQKSMLLLTDGIDAGKAILPLDAAQQAAKDTIAIYTLGIGKAKGSGGYDLDEKTLKDIASATGGKYFNAMDEDGLKDVYATLDKLQPVEYEEESYKPVTLLYYYPLGAGLLLALVFQFLSGLVKILWVWRK
jgi:Ca-activated chloride channel family protein